MLLTVRRLDLSNTGNNKVRQSGPNPDESQPGQAQAMEVQQYVSNIQAHEAKHCSTAPHYLQEKFNLAAGTVIVAHLACPHAVVTSIHLKRTHMQAHKLRAGHTCMRR